MVGVEKRIATQWANVSQIICTVDIFADSSRYLDVILPWITLNLKNNNNIYLICISDRITAEKQIHATKILHS